MFILSNNNKILYISDNLDSCLLFYIERIIDFIEIYKYLLSSNNFSNELNKYFSNHFIGEYYNNIALIRKITFDFDKNYFIVNGKNMDVNNDIKNKLNSIFIDNSKIFETQTNLDIFIPISELQTTNNNVINTEFINKLEKENKEIDIDFIKKRMEELTKIKDNEINKISTLKNKIDSKLKDINKELIKTKTIKTKIKYEKEKWDEIKRKFNINLDIYKKIKDEISNGERDENNIPELFIYEFEIFEKIKEHLNDDNLFDIYINEKQNIKEKTITNFEQLFETDIYIDDKSDNDSVNEDSSDYYIEDSDDLEIN